LCVAVRQRPRYIDLGPVKAPRSNAEGLRENEEASGRAGAWMLSGSRWFLGQIVRVWGERAVRIRVDKVVVVVVVGVVK
jgi:hypothetical protein